MWHTHRYKTTHTHNRSNPQRMLAQLGHTPPFGAPLLAATPPPGPASDARTFWCWNRRGGRVPPGAADVRFGLCSGRSRAHQPLYKVTSLFWLVWRERWSSGPEAFGVSCLWQRSLCAQVKSLLLPPSSAGKTHQTERLETSALAAGYTFANEHLEKYQYIQPKTKKKNTLFCCEEALIRS